MRPVFVQFQCELGKSIAVADAILERIEETSEVYSTSGNYDLLAKFYLTEAQSIPEFINDKVQKIPGVRDTYTIIAFRIGVLEPLEAALPSGAQPKSG